MKTPSKTDYPMIAKEGRVILLLAFMAMIAAMVWFNAWVIFPTTIFFVFALQFFRDPVRLASGGDKDITSPADGRVVIVAEAIDPVRHLPALKISVFMNVFNIHSNKSPTTGTIIKREYHAGSFLNAELDKASEANERCALTVARDDGIEITFVQIAGLVARRILNYTQVGETLNKGDRYGFIRFGSRVDVYLPLDARPKVAVGDVVKNNTTILATLD